MPEHLIAAIRPDVLAKGGTTSQIIGSHIVEAYGGKVVRTGTLAHRSTTATIERIMETAAGEPEVYHDA